MIDTEGPPDALTEWADRHAIGLCKPLDRPWYRVTLPPGDTRTLPVPCRCGRTLVDLRRYVCADQNILYLGQCLGCSGACEAILFGFRECGGK